MGLAHYAEEVGDTQQLWHLETRGVMVIFLGNWLGDSSSNPGLSCSYLTNVFCEEINYLFFPSKE